MNVKNSIIIMILIITLSSLTVWANVKVYFSPNDSCDKILISYIDKSIKTLDIAIYSLTKDSIAKSIIDAKKRGVNVRLIIDRSQAGSVSADDEEISCFNIPVLRVRGSKGGIMHNKYAIIDDKYIITGSYNWTDNATYKNDENLLIIDNLLSIIKYKKDFDRLWGLNK